MLPHPLPNANPAGDRRTAHRHAVDLAVAQRNPDDRAHPDPYRHSDRGGLLPEFGHHAGRCRAPRNH